MRRFTTTARLAEADTPLAAPVVMASGVLSICFQSLGPTWLSDALLAVAALVWLSVAAGCAARWRVGRWPQDAAEPGSLALVAATAALGSRLTGSAPPALAQALLTLGVLLWLALLPTVLRHWHTPTVGSAFLVCVATQALAILAAKLSWHGRSAWEAYPAAAALVLGLPLYGLAAYRFDPRQPARGHGSHWVFGGALAISSLATVELLRARAHLGAHGWPEPVLRDLAQALWWAAVVAYAALAVAELRWPRPHYDVQRWSTVFPLAVLALASLRMSEVLPAAPLRPLGTALAWLALTVWLVVSTGGIRRAAAACGPRWPALRYGHPPRHRVLRGTPRPGGDPGVPAFSPGATAVAVGYWGRGHRRLREAIGVQSR